jgi:sugar phosphate isomerase/epimerase
MEMVMLSRRNLVATALAAAAVPVSTPLWADPLGLRPGIQLYTVRDALAADAPGTLKQLAAIGYRTVEAFDLGKYSPRDFRKLLAANGMACASVHLNFRNGDNGGLFDIAHDLGARYVVSAGLFGAVGANPASANETAFHAMASLANRIGAAAKKAGLNFALHNHNMEFRKVGRGPGFDLLLAETDPGMVGFEMDCGWVAVAGHDPAAYLKAHPGRFPLLHVKDFQRPPGPRTAPGGPPGAILGTGFIDYRPIFAAVSKTGNGGVRQIFVEQEPPYKAFTALEAARRDLAYLHSL